MALSAAAFASDLSFALSVTVRSARYYIGVRSIMAHALTDEAKCFMSTTVLLHRKGGRTISWTLRG